ncbi:GNAT family N-acetyltransferase [Pontibacter silvestris]|nr:GNAT family N-acetyltransferase [Pontibacter silvestris]
MLQVPEMSFHTISAEGHIVGLSVHWQLNGFLYLEHLTITPEQRGRGIGKEAVTWLLRQSEETVVLEVERPVDGLSLKRIQFYKSLGFVLYDQYDYYQPPYEPSAQPVPLYLMSKPTVATNEKLAEMATAIKQQVYERFYN